MISQVRATTEQVHSRKTCWQQIEALLANPEKARKLGHKAQASIRENDNMLERYLAEIKPYL